MSKIIIINGPNLNLLGQREQSQYGSKDYNHLTDICYEKAKELDLNLDIKQSNVEGEIVNLIQNVLIITMVLLLMLQLTVIHL